MRNTFAETFYEAAKLDEKLCMVVADISPAGSMNAFRKEFPSRFINTGVAEQAMIGIVAGMSCRGLKPFAYTIATFALFRPFEFIRDDLCYQNLPVTVVGVGGGLSYSTLGGTHHAMDDIAVACALPNMRVIAPCDPVETAAATQWCISQTEGPVYLRLGKAGEPVLSSEAATPFEFGKIRTLRQGKDVCILGYGPILNLAFKAADELAQHGISCQVISVHTLKPLDNTGISEVLAAFKNVIVLEEMVPRGGLADKVKGLCWESNAKCTLNTISLKDEFIHIYGSHEQLLQAHDVTVSRVVKSALNK